MSAIGNQNLRTQKIKKFWSAVHIILSEKFSALFILALSLLFIQSNFLEARETFVFDLGQKINVLSDKAFRKTSENEFEAVGNVVITHLSNTIYGEKAKVNFTTGDTEVIGNVRYITPQMTLYGTKLQYNFITREIDLDNARVLSDNYVITGKKILQSNPDIIYAEEAEYTTCRDCPESWSIFGKRVTIEVGNYIRIKHAFIKVNGVVAMYFPYIVFPIKQRRESGLLFPALGFSSKEGFHYRQPYFWAIDDYKDATLTPSSFGKRGVGGDLQYRQNIAENTRFEFNTLQLNDGVYAPYKTSKDLSGEHYYRHFSDLEFHSGYKRVFNNHFYFNGTSDLDTIRDFDYFTKDKTHGTEVGGGGFLEGRSSLFSLTAEGYFNKNMLVKDPREFDNRYVQMLPKLSLSSVPYNVLNTHYPFAKNISFGLNSDFTIFKQNKADLTGPIRNARRTNLAPYMNWQLGNIGPVLFSHQLKLDYQNYIFPNESDKKFTKHGLVYETEAKIELERVFGLSYVERLHSIKVDPVSKSNDSLSTIGELPKFKSINEDSVEEVSNNSYRHSQEYKIKHYYLSDQQSSGNVNFKKQIEEDAGQFDYVDAVRAKEHLTNQVTAQDSLPVSNTVEFQWNNRLIKKSSKSFDPYTDGRYLNDNFSYSDIAFLKLSQGIDFNIKSSKPAEKLQLIDKLTRLYAETGLTLDNTSFSVQEFYFHKTSEHKFNSTAAYNFSRLTLNGTFTYSSFNSSNTPISKSLGYGAVFRPTDLVTLSNSSSYDMASKKITQTNYALAYAPLNHCWKIEFNYAKDLIDKKFGFLFYINYNENNFLPINVK